MPSVIFHKVVRDVIDVVTLWASEQILLFQPVQNTLGKVQLFVLQLVPFDNALEFVQKPFMSEPSCPKAGHTTGFLGDKIVRLNLHVMPFVTTCLDRCLAVPVRFQKRVPGLFKTVSKLIQCFAVLGIQCPVVEVEWDRLVNLDSPVVVHCVDLLLVWLVCSFTG